MTGIPWRLAAFLADTAGGERGRTSERTDDPAPAGGARLERGDG